MRKEYHDTYVENYTGKEKEAYGYIELNEKEGTLKFREYDDQVRKCDSGELWATYTQEDMESPFSAYENLKDFYDSIPYEIDSNDY